MLSKLLKAVEIFAALWGVAAFLYYWDPSRILVKRLVANDTYLYETIEPRYRDVAVDRLITVRGPEDVTERRRALIHAVWGDAGFPADIRPDAVTRDVRPDLDRSTCPTGKDALYFSSLECKIGLYRDVPGLARIDKLVVPVGDDYRAIVSYFVPQRSNGGLVLYHHGYAGTHNEQHRNLIRLIARGYGVLAFNLHGYGDNVDRVTRLPVPARPLEAARWILNPVIAALNMVAADYDPRRIAMVGFSAGGWATAMAAAIDPRIRSSFIIASPYPVAFRKAPSEGPDITRIREILDAAGYLDMFITAAAGDKDGPRRQMQIYNRYDRCCWNNLTASLFRQPVADIVTRLGGSFDVLIDESHARHKISGWAMTQILAALEEPTP
ncbi:MAG: alpha/beta hydrolase family protein [Alphaproteobacteria bacterium]